MRVGIDRGLFAFSMASLAVLSLVYGDFAPSGQSLPSGIPGRELWAHLFALLLLVASAGVCFSRTALPSALFICAYLAAWGAIDAVPIFSQPLSLGVWYGLCEAVTSLAGAWILYTVLRRQGRTSDMPVASERTVRFAQVAFGLTCVFYGWSHFVYSDYTTSMVPEWLPARSGLTYLTGLGHIAAGIAIVVGVLPRLAITLEAIMMSLFGLLVWAPSFFAQPRPVWATPPHNQWTEVVVNLLLVAAAVMVATSYRHRPWGLAQRARADRH